MVRTHSHTWIRLSGLVFVLSALAACAHPAPSAVTGSGGTGGPGGGGGPATVTFSMADLDGAWYGKLVPTSLALAKRNFYVKISSGVVTEAADSLGNEWLSADSNHNLDFTTSGVLNLAISSLVRESEMILNAQMDDSMALLTGTFSAVAYSETLSEGSFVLQRSGGANEFTLANLAGDWIGYGTNDRGNRRTLELSLGNDGSVDSAQVIHPVTLTPIHVYSAGAGLFAFGDDSVGRLDNVVMLADDGSITTFHYLLVAQDGSLLGGPGFDTRMGRGVVTLGPSSD